MIATSAGQLARGVAKASDPSARRLLTVLLRRYRIPVVETVTADGAESAVEAAWWLGFPVTLVAEGARLSDESGITRCGLATPSQVRTAYRQLAAGVGPSMTGVRMRRQPQQGAEVIIGVTRDADGGAHVSLTLGGPAAALVGARVTRPAPISPRDARDMLKELHEGTKAEGAKAEGAKAEDAQANGATAPTGRAGGLGQDRAAGEPAALDLEALAAILEQVGKLAVQVPDITELELSPVIVTGCGAAVAGVRGRFRTSRVAHEKPAKLRSVC
ncbi:MAG: acetate--CoA ligase family protein [Micromonosporaceae bacterium]